MGSLVASPRPRGIVYHSFVGSQRRWARRIASYKRARAWRSYTAKSWRHAPFRLRIFRLCVLKPRIDDGGFSEPYDGKICRSRHFFLKRDYAECDACVCGVQWFMRCGLFT